MTRRTLLQRLTAAFAGSVLAYTPLAGRWYEPEEAEKAETTRHAWIFKQPNGTFETQDVTPLELSKMRLIYSDGTCRSLWSSDDD